MIARWLAIGSLAGLLCALAWALWLRGNLVSLEAERADLARRLVAAEAARAMAAEARDVAKAHIARLERERREFDALGFDLQGMEGRDAPLSDHLRGVAGRLWP